ncbi:MAG: hypothetical protein QNJ64_03145 [Crocosphaera sp.]|nr:hypothetical protein [Crocosphaera sp.]
MNLTKLLFATCAIIPGFIASSSALGANVFTASTSFNTTDGFVTGDFDPVTISDGLLEVTFSGGQQQQMFDVPSYNSNPAAYLFINGPGGFTGGFGNTAAPTGDTGLIDFNVGVSEVSFFAANRGNGAGVTLNILGVDDSTVLDSIFITQTSNQIVDAAVATIISSSDVGGLIGSIAIDLPGPAGIPPYVLAIDTFSATASVPESNNTLALMLLGIVGASVVAKRQLNI